MSRNYFKDNRLKFFSPLPGKTKTSLWSCFVVFMSITVTLQGQIDTSMLTLNEYIQYVSQHHPIARQANIKIQEANAKGLEARGNFDPTLSTSWNGKEFQATPYYNLFETKLKIPAWYSLNIHAGYENTSGAYLNPEATTPDQGLWSVGLEADLLRGLLLDERRAALKQAKLWPQLAAAERAKMLNDLLVNAGSAYVYWQAVYARKRIILNNIALAQSYLEATRTSFIMGAKTAMDTLEAFLLVSDQQTLLEANEVLLARATQQMEAFLWMDNMALEVQDDVRPDSLYKWSLPDEPFLPADTISRAHPYIQSLTLKSFAMDIERRLKAEALKPSLSVTFTPLIAASSVNTMPSPVLDNYKWGLRFQMPLLFRQARAGVQQMDLSLQSLRFEIADESNKLSARIESLRQEMKALENQLILQQQNMASSKQLLDAEYVRFNAGESSVFILNKRQEYFYGLNVKYLDLMADYNRSILQWLSVTDSIRAHFGLQN